MFTKPLGLGADALNDISPGVFSSASGLSKSQEMAHQVQREDAVRRAELKQQKLDAARQKHFVASAVLGTLRPVWLEKSLRLKQKYLEVIGECDSYKASMDEDAKTRFKDAFDTFVLRLDLLKAVLGGSQGADPDEDAREFDEFIHSERVQEARQLHEPHPALDNLQNYAAAHRVFTEMTVTTYAESEELKATLNRTHKDMTELVTHVRGQLTRLKGLMGRRQRQLAKDESKRVAGDRRTATSAMKRLKTSGGKAAAVLMANGGMKVAVEILDDIPEACYRAMLVVDAHSVPWIPTDAEAIKPAVIHFQTGALITKEHAATVDVFLAKFKTSQLYENPGRGHAVLKNDAAVNPPCPVQLCTSRLRPTLTPLALAMADATWHFAASGEHEAVGTEFLGLGSVKAHVSGERRVLCVSVHGLLQFCKHGVSAGSSVSLDHLYQLLKSGDKTLMDSLVKAHVEMYAHDLFPGDVLYVPWGYIVAERILNGHDMGGFRWSILSQFATESALDAAQLLLPAQPSKIPHGSTMALLVKVIKGLKKSGSATVQQLIDSRFSADYFTQPSVKQEQKASQPSASSSKRPVGAAGPAKRTKVC